MTCADRDTPAAPPRARSAGAVPPPTAAALRWTCGAGAVDHTRVAGCWVAAAPPRAAPGQRLEVARRFMADAARHGCRVTWFGVDARFAAHLGLPSLRIGAEPWWRADRWDTTLRTTRSLRAQLHRAANKGVRVRAATSQELADARLPAALDRLVRRWTELHELPPMRFLCELDPARRAEQRTLWLAETDAGLVGCAGAQRAAGAATVITELLRDPSAPNGTTELLFDAVQREAAAAGHGRVTLGLAPLHGEVGRLLGAVRFAMRHHYDFAGVSRWKSKLRPHRWCAQHLAFAPELPPWRALLDVGRAFAGCSLRRCAARSLARSVRRAVLGSRPR